MFRQENYNGLTYGDLIFIDENNYLVCDQELLRKLLYVGLVMDCIQFESVEITNLAESVIANSNIIEDLGNKLIEDTLGSTILNNFKGLMAVALGDAGAWTEAYTDMTVDFGKNTALYLMMLAELHSLMMDAVDAELAALKADGASTEESAMFADVEEASSEKGETAPLNAEN